MSTLRDAAQQALEALSQFEYRSEGCIRPDFVDVACAALRTAMAEQPAEQEPVAKVDYKQRDGFRWLNYLGWQRIPDGADLYTAPQPKPAEQESADGCVVVARPVLRKLGIDDAIIDTIARPQPTKREPLSVGRIEEIFEEIFINEAGVDEPTHIRFARAIERAHGIGGQA